MRKHIQSNTTTGYKIIAVDDDSGVLDSLSVLLNRNGYNFVGITDPIQAIERVKKEHFDLMLLDFMMTPIHGDKVVEEIRKFNKELYILLLTGHKDLAPPLETIRKLDIQCYCEKSDKFDQLLLLVEAAIKSVEQLNEINRINNELSDASAGFSSTLVLGSSLGSSFFFSGPSLISSILNGTASPTFISPVFFSSSVFLSSSWNNN